MNLNNLQNMKEWCGPQKYNTMAMMKWTQTSFLKYLQQVATEFLKMYVFNKVLSIEWLTNKLIPSN